ncbi:hypothetical protein Tco_0223261 [Tanacetum coccineum]
MESLNSNSQEREMHQLQQMQDKAKEKCMESFRLLHSHLKVLSIKGGFERACVALFDQDNQTFTESLLLNLDNLEKQLDREEFQETESIGAFRKSIDERAQHKRENNRRVNDRVMQSKEGKVDSSTALDAGLVVTESNETESERHVSSSRSGKDTHAEDAEVHFAIPEKERIRSLFADKSDISETKAPLSKKRRVYTLQCALSSKREISSVNPVKEILLKLNLPDHRSILTDLKILKDGGEDLRYSDTDRLSRSDEVLKLKNFKKDATLKLSKSTNQEWYEHVGPEVTRSQDEKVTRWRNEIMLG